MEVPNASTSCTFETDRQKDSIGVGGRNRRSWSSVRGWLQQDRHGAGTTHSGEAECSGTVRPTLCLGSGLILPVKSTRASQRHGTSGHVEDHPRDPARLLGRKKDGRVRNVLGHTQASDGVPLDHGFLLLRGDPLQVPLGENRFWSNAVGPDAEGTYLGRKVLGEDLD